MFYLFTQTNSGGSHVRNERVDIYVFVEADNAIQANEIAVDRAGIYFDGVENERDCECCGDRWYRASEPGLLEPMVYDTPLADVNPKDKWLAPRANNSIIYSAAGTIVHYSVIAAKREAAKASEKKNK